MEVLHHGWDLGEATVREVRERILENRDVAGITVMKNLDGKGTFEIKQIIDRIED